MARRGGRTALRSSLRSNAPSPEVHEDSARVDKAAAALEKQLLRVRGNGYGIDLPVSDDKRDAGKADALMALAAMKLLKKYGDQLVLSRYRGRVTLAWRATTFAMVNEADRNKLDAFGFYANASSSLDDLRTGIDPNEVGGGGGMSPERLQKRNDRNRRARVREWARKGWTGDPGWKEWGGSPEQVKASREHKAFMREQAAKLSQGGKIQVAGRDVQIGEMPKPKTAPKILAPDGTAAT